MKIYVYIYINLEGTIWPRQIKINLALPRLANIWPIYIGQIILGQIELIRPSLIKNIKIQKNLKI